MCTLTWRITDNGYQVLFNRDEQKTRSIALPPQTFQQDDCYALMPIDPDGQGTWIATNNHGFSLCLLNNYQGQMPATIKKNNALKSRGQLVRQFAFCFNEQQLEKQLGTIRWSDFPPFTLLIFDLNKLQRKPEVSAIIWDGIEVEHTKKESPITSSSFEFEQVQAARVTHFNRQTNSQSQASLCELMNYHSSHEPQAGAHSVCMHRDDAQTVSLTMINVDSNQVTMDYQPGAPCQHQPLHSSAIPRTIKMEIQP